MLLNNLDTTGITQCPNKLSVQESGAGHQSISIPKAAKVNLGIDKEQEATPFIDQEKGYLIYVFGGE